LVARNVMWKKFMKRSESNNFEGELEMKIGIIGYGSMGKMIYEKISQSENLSQIGLFISNRTKENKSILR